MKHLSTLAAIALTSAALSSCTFGGANGPILGSTSTGAGTQAGSKAGTLVQGLAGTLANGNTISNLLSSFLGNVPVSEQTLYGAWTYQHVSIAFESENFLAKAGGAVVAGTIENSIDSQLQKYGIRPGAVKFTFNSDHSFTANLGGRNITGTYTYDPATRKLNLNAALGLLNMTATVGTTTRGIALLFPADKLLTLFSAAGSLLGNANSNLGAISGLLQQYKGMQIGLEMTK